MKRLASVAFALSCFVGLNAAAQVPDRTQTEATKQTGNGPVVKTRTETVSGTVKEYEAGKKIKISGPADKTYVFDLDENARIDGSIVVGQAAKVTFQKRSDGTEHVTVVSEASPQAQMDATAPKMHSESTTKETGPGVDTRTKSEVVIGTVKAFEPGKKLTVAGPKSKDFSFDLDEQVVLKGAISVGDRVKVTYTTTDSGQKVMTVEPYHKA